MKKFITVIISSLGLVALGAASSQTASAPPGTDNIAAGYGAGYKSGGSNSDVICIGTDAGMNSSNNTECVFIGKNAGKGKKSVSRSIIIGDDTNSNQYEKVNIGNIFRYEENDTYPKYYCNSDYSTFIVKTLDVESNFHALNGGGFWGSVSFNRSESGGDISVFGYNSYDDNLYIFKPLYVDEYATIYFEKSNSVNNIEFQNFDDYVDLYAKGTSRIIITSENKDVSINGGTSINFESPKLNMTIGGKDGAYLTYESGSLAVYTNGVKIGTMTFTPVQ